MDYRVRRFLRFLKEHDKYIEFVKRVKLCFLMNDKGTSQKIFVDSLSYMVNRFSLTSIICWFFKTEEETIQCLRFVDDNIDCQKITRYDK